MTRKVQNALIIRGYDLFEDTKKDTKSSITYLVFSQNLLFFTAAFQIFYYQGQITRFSLIFVKSRWKPFG